MADTLDREHLESGAIKLQGAGLVAYAALEGKGGGVLPFSLKGGRLENGSLQGAAAHLRPG